MHRIARVQIYIQKATRLRASMTIYLRRLYQTMLAKDEGTTAVEYAVLIAIIVVFCLASVISTGDFQKQVWIDTSASIENAINNSN